MISGELAIAVTGIVFVVGLTLWFYSDLAKHKYPRR